MVVHKSKHHFVAGFVALTFGGTIAVAYVTSGVALDKAVREVAHSFLSNVCGADGCADVVPDDYEWRYRFSSYGLAFMGGWLRQMSGFTQSSPLVTVGMVTSLIVPSEALWRRAEFYMQTPLAISLPFSPFANVSIPSRTMIFYAAFYLFAAFAIALYRF